MHCNKLCLAAIFFALLYKEAAEAKIYTRCQLAKTLDSNGFPRSFLVHWVCLVEKTSQRDTSLLKDYPNKTSSYGLFQINSKDWCRKGRKGGLCNVKCEDFLDEKLDDDIKCAKLIFEKKGFNGWPAWTNYCKNKPLPDLSHC